MHVYLSTTLTLTDINILLSWNCRPHKPANDMMTMITSCAGGWRFACWCFLYDWWVILCFGLESFHPYTSCTLRCLCVGRGLPQWCFAFAVLVCVCGHFPKAHHGDESSANHPIEYQQQQYFELVELGKISHLLKQKVYVLLFLFFLIRQPSFLDIM